jgi:hypothetical protein
MKCNKAWSYKFIATHLTKTFMRGEYAAHRKELLLQQQLSRMAESMPAVEYIKKISAIYHSIKHLKAQRVEIRAHVNEIKASLAQEHKVYRDNSYTEDLKANLAYVAENADIYIKTISNFEQELLKTKDTDELLISNIRKLQHDIEIIQTGGQLVSDEKKEARKFIMPCPNGDCRGYLSEKYKCELCEHQTCSKCLDVIGLIEEGGDKKNTPEHVCKQENIDSADFIKKQSKPCPCCGARISKIDGCDQMWCTQCHKAFSWNTGKIIMGTIHNPHFYQYQRDNALDGVAPRNPGDVVCGGLCQSRQLIHAINNAKIACLSRENKEVLVDTLLNIHRLQTHMTALHLNPLRAQIRTELNYEEERIEYIFNRITKEQLANKIMRKDNARKKNVEILYIFELFTAVAIDMFNSILLSENKDAAFVAEVKKHMSEYHKLRMYCNEHFKEVSMLYGICVPFIDEEWVIDSTKYNSKGKIDKYIEVRTEKRRVRKELNQKKEQEWIARRAEEYEKRQRAREQVIQAQSEKVEVEINLRERLQEQFEAMHLEEKMQSLIL